MAAAGVGGVRDLGEYSFHAVPTAPLSAVRRRGGRGARALGPGRAGRAGLSPDRQVRIGDDPCVRNPGRDPGRHVHRRVRDAEENNRKILLRRLSANMKQGLQPQPLFLLRMI